MSFQDIETGLAQAPHASPLGGPGAGGGGSGGAPQSREEAAFVGLQSSLSLQVFKINANVQGILKLVDQLGTKRDTGGVRTALWVFSLIYKGFVMVLMKCGLGVKT